MQATIPPSDGGGGGRKRAATLAASFLGLGLVAAATPRLLKVRAPEPAPATGQDRAWSGPETNRPPVGSHGLPAYDPMNRLLELYSKAPQTPESKQFVEEARSIPTISKEFDDYIELNHDEENPREGFRKFANRLGDLPEFRKLVAKFAQQPGFKQLLAYLAAESPMVKQELANQFDRMDAAENGSAAQREQATVHGGLLARGPGAHGSGARSSLAAAGGIGTDARAGGGAASAGARTASAGAEATSLGARPLDKEVLFEPPAAAKSAASAAKPGSEPPNAGPNAHEVAVTLETVETAQSKPRRIFEELYPWLMGEFSSSELDALERMIGDYGLWGACFANRWYQRCFDACSGAAPKPGEEDGKGKCAPPGDPGAHAWKSCLDWKSSPETCIARCKRQSPCAVPADVVATYCQHQRECCSGCGGPTAKDCCRSQYHLADIFSFGGEHQVCLPAWEGETPVDDGSAGDGSGDEISGEGEPVPGNEGSCARVTAEYKYVWHPVDKRCYRYRRNNRDTEGGIHVFPKLNDRGKCLAKTTETHTCYFNERAGRCTCYTDQAVKRRKDECRAKGCTFRVVWNRCDCN